LKMAKNVPPITVVSDEEMCSGSEAGSYLRFIDFVHHSTLGLRVIKNKKSLKCNFDSPFGASTPLLEL